MILNLDDDVLGFDLLVTKDRKINRKLEIKTKQETSQECVENSQELHDNIEM